MTDIADKLRQRIKAEQEAAAQRPAQASGGVGEVSSATHPYTCAMCGLRCKLVVQCGECAEEGCLACVPGGDGGICVTCDAQLEMNTRPQEAPGDALPSGDMSQQDEDELAALHEEWAAGEEPEDTDLGE